VIKPTRGELLHTKKRIVLARRGHDLLKKKQDSLVIEFFGLLQRIKEEHRLLGQSYHDAQGRMAVARALESDIRITTIAAAVQAHAPVALRLRNIAGVKVPETVVPAITGAAAHESMTVQDVAAAYLIVVQRTVRLAASETAMRRILIEIRKVKRRAHALEHTLIPQLLQDKKHITFELEERAREEFTRLKKRKK
jgi:V/A-type H+-transporting ATPase subunit D